MTQEHVPSPAPAAEAELVSELAALAYLLHQGAPEVQAASRAGVRWLPAGVLIEQLVADLTLVYALPKVGGTTVAATLARHPAVRPEPLHLHHRSRQGLAALDRVSAGCAHPNVAYLRAQVAQGRGALALLAANRALRRRGLSAVVRKPYVVAGVRDPVALSVSLAFESWWLFADRPEALGDEFPRTWVLESVRGVIDDWFADELGAVLGVDVYARPFPAERDWEVYETDAVRALVVWQENLARLPEALGALDGLAPETSETATRNVAAHKEYAGRYADVTRTFRLTESELDRAYDLRAVRHFYTADEVAVFRRRWSSEPAAGPPAASTPTPVSPEPARERAAEPHPWACRPCWHCEQQLRSLPGLQHACAEQAARLRQLREAWWPRPAVAFVARKLRALARRVARSA